jgi:hypothetical protein
MPTNFVTSLMLRNVTISPNAAKLRESSRKSQPLLVSAGANADERSSEQRIKIDQAVECHQ